MIMDVDDRIACTVCGRTFHLECAGISAVLFRDMQENGQVMWVCSHCKQNASGLFEVLKNVSTQHAVFEAKTEKRFGEIENRLAKLEKDGSGGGHRAPQEPAESRDQIVAEVVSEMKDIEFRKANVMIYGIQESVSTENEERKSHDQNEVARILSALDTDPRISFDIKAFFRVGMRRVAEGNDATKPRPLKVVFSSEDQKIAALRSSRSLMNKYPTIFIRPDLTPAQMDERRAEAKRRADQESKGVKASGPRGRGGQRRTGSGPKGITQFPQRRSGSPVRAGEGAVKVAANAVANAPECDDNRPRTRSTTTMGLKSGFKPPGTGSKNAVHPPPTSRIKFR
jgi:hypothetical protein